jgi:hypothetical protein
MFKLIGSIVKFILETVFSVEMLIGIVILVGVSLWRDDQQRLRNQQLQREARERSVERSNESAERLLETLRQQEALQQAINNQIELERQTREQARRERGW